MNTGSSTGDTGGVARRTSKGDSSSSSSSNDSEIAVLRRRDRNPNGKGWSKWKSILTRADEYYSFSFPDKQGELTIRTNFLNVETRKSIAEELMHQQHHMHLFRQYSIRSTPEPRVHFLLHSHATAHPQQQQQQQEECQLDDINNNKHPQPGYAYANIRMKAHALHCLPHVERLAQDLQIKYEATDTPPNHNNSNVKNRNDDANIRYFDVETIPIPTTGGATISSTATARVHDSDEVYMNNDVISNEDIAESVNQEDGSDKDDSDYKDSDDDALDSEKYVRNPKEFAHKQNCLGDFWTIGVDAILYRNGQDSMGFHADDDQGEQLIVTAIISSSSGEASRFIRFRRKRRGSKHYNAGKNLRSLDFELEMCLQAGDVYSMDGTMQQHYEHGVLKKCPRKTQFNGTNCTNTNEERLAIVFRRGDLKVQYKDTGTPCMSLAPKVKRPLIFGKVAHLEEGNTYSRKELLDLDGTRSPQGGVSGNKKEGCDSLIVSGRRPDGLDQNDTLVRLTYAASTKQAALAILNSTAEQKPVRIFRSGALKNCLRPISKAFTKKPTQYRFDGLYYVRDVCFIPNDTPNRRVRDGFFTHPRSFRAVLLDAATKIASAAERKLYQNGVFVFLLDRSNENRHNDIDNQQYIQYCVLIESMPSEALQVCASPTRELRKRKRTSPR